MSFILVLCLVGSKSLLLIKVKTNVVERKSIESRLYQDFKKDLTESFVKTFRYLYRQEKDFCGSKRNKDSPNRVNI